MIDTFVVAQHIQISSIAINQSRVGQGDIEEDDCGDHDGEQSLHRVMETVCYIVTIIALRHPSASYKDAVKVRHFVGFRFGSHILLNETSAGCSRAPVVGLCWYFGAAGYVG